MELKQKLLEAFLTTSHHHICQHYRYSHFLSNNPQKSSHKKKGLSKQSSKTIGLRVVATTKKIYSLLTVKDADSSKSIHYPLKHGLLTCEVNTVGFFWLVIFFVIFTLSFMIFTIFVKIALQYEKYYHDI